MEKVSDSSTMNQGRRRKSVADVQSVLNRAKNDIRGSGPELQAIAEEVPHLRTPLSSLTDSNIQATSQTKALDLPKKLHRRSSSVNTHAEGQALERKQSLPVSQVRSFMEVKRSEEAHIVKALKLEEMVMHLQADLAREKQEALESRVQVSELKAILSETEKDKEILSSRYALIRCELVEAQSELKELKADLATATDECRAAKLEASSSQAAATAACDRMKALTEIMQRRGVSNNVNEQDMVMHELQSLQAKVHEQDKFASNLNDLHNQVEKTRQEIRARLIEASERASAIGLGGIVERTFGPGKLTLSLAIESESSTSACREGELTPVSNRAEGDGEQLSSQKSLSRQLSDLSALSRRSSIPGLQTEDSSENSPEYVSLLASLSKIPEAADSLVAVNSQTQFDSPVGMLVASPVYHRRTSSDAGIGCTQDLSQLFEAKQNQESVKGAKIDTLGPNAAAT